MKSKKLTVIWSLMVTSLLSVGSAAMLAAQRGSSTPSPDDFSRVNAVKYAQGKVGPLLADLYLPNEPGLRPAIVYIHGGGWTGGGRNGVWSKLIAPFAQQGYVGMAIDYDLSPGVQFPVALEECKEAVRWLRAHASEYHVDPNRIAIAGGSAGGELAALVALTGGDVRYEAGAYRDFSSSVKAAILYSSDLDLTKFSDTDSAILAYLGGSCAAKRDLCLQASPQFHLNGRLPPIFIGHGNADKDVPYSQFTNFVAAYKNANGPIMAFTAERGPHSYAAEPQWFQKNADAVLLFLNKNL
ncbi:MAG: alpha/beta hydrolase [Acidobacteriaceae bacterium]